MRIVARNGRRCDDTVSEGGGVILSLAGTEPRPTALFRWYKPIFGKAGFRPRRMLPRILVLLLCWDEGTAEGFDAQVKLLFDETITARLDIEAIVILS